jgi:glutaminyl-peptide cyclotransferase
MTRRLVLTAICGLVIACGNAGESTPPISQAATPAPVAFDADRAFSFLQDQCNFGPRHPGSPGHDECRTWLVEMLRKQTDQITIQDFPYHNLRLSLETTLTNVLATFPGADAEKTGAILLCAHWDTRPWASSESDPALQKQPIIGANDGASGVAVLLEIAHQLKQRPPARDVLIALWDGEDSGREGYLEEWFLGARHWAQHPTRQDIRWGVLLDMVGDKNLEFPQEYISVNYAPDLVQRVWKRGAQLGFNAFQFFPKHAVQDDHLPLLEAGFQVIDMIDFDYPFWHTLQDTPDKCSPASLRVSGETLLSLIYDE